MSVAPDEQRVQSMLAAVWDQPRRKVDTATVLEVYPNQFSASVLAGILGLLSFMIWYIAGADVIETEVARSIRPIALVLGLVGSVVGVVMFLRILSGKGKYKDGADFAGSVIEHILSHPGAPNTHLFETVGLPGSFGSDAAETATAAIHQWIAATRGQLATALLAAAKLPPEEAADGTDPAALAEVLAGRLDGQLGQLTTHERICPVTGGTATLIEATQPVTFRVKAGGAADELPEAVRRLCDAVLRGEAHCTVVQAPCGDWYVLSASLDELGPSQAA